MQNMTFAFVLGRELLNLGRETNNSRPELYNLRPNSYLCNIFLTCHYGHTDMWFNLYDDVKTQ